MPGSSCIPSFPSHDRSALKQIEAVREGLPEGTFLATPATSLLLQDHEPSVVKERLDVKTAYHLALE